jgi:hypothetical protein
MPSTARALKLTINDEIDERYHFEKSTIAAVKHIKYGFKSFGSWTSAAASYNRGVGGLAAAFKTQKVKSYYDLYLNDETSRYLFRILALKEVLENPQRYGFSMMQADNYAVTPTRALTVTSTIEDLPEFALEQGTNYKTLRLLNPWLRSYKLTLTDTTTRYTLQVPEQAIKE